LPAARPSPRNRLREFVDSLSSATPRAFVTPTILAVNVAIYVWMGLTGPSLWGHSSEELLDWGANFGPDVGNGAWWRLLAATYVHVHWLHILCNMIVFWDVGQFVERLLGNVGFLLLYTFCGLFASLASVYFHPYVVSAGASGAIFGVVGALAAYLVIKHRAIPKDVAERLLGGVGMFVLLNVAIGFAIPGIDNAAHLGGLGAGFVLGMILRDPLDGPVARQRAIRNTACLALGAGLLILGVRELPPRVDLRQLVRDALATEEQAIDSLKSFEEQVDAGQRSPQEFAEMIERDVLPQWSAVRGKLESVDDLPAHVQANVDRLGQYFLLREASWRSLAAHFRTGEPRHLEEFLRAKAAADALASSQNQAAPSP